MREHSPEDAAAEDKGCKANADISLASPQLIRRTSKPSAALCSSNGVELGSLFAAEATTCAAARARAAASAALPPMPAAVPVLVPVSRSPGGVCHHECEGLPGVSVPLRLLFCSAPPPAPAPAQDLAALPSHSSSSSSSARDSASSLRPSASACTRMAARALRVSGQTLLRVSVGPTVPPPHRASTHGVAAATGSSVGLCKFLRWSSRL